MLTPNLERIPPELKALPNWVTYRPNKTPVNPVTGKNARADDPTTWGKFGQAVEQWESQKGNGIAGLGYEFSADDPFCGIDLDKCREPETGEIEAWAKAIIERLQSYAEVSPSGRGLHILVAGKLPPGGRRKGQIEMYDSGRYFTMTGDHLEGTPSTIENRQAELEALHGEIFGKAHASSTRTHRDTSASLGISDKELIAKASNARNGLSFSKLWAGYWIGDYSSQSEADQALCNSLAFWTRKNPEHMDRLFRQSDLMRDKWDAFRGSQTYGEITIAKAIASTQQVWRGNGKRRKSKTAQGKPPEPGSETAGGPGVPAIIITQRFLHDKANDGIKALEAANNPPSLFRRSGSLVRISVDEKEHPRIETLGDTQLRSRLARVAHFLKKTDEGMVPTAPPMDLVKDILALGEWNFPALEGIIQAPAMRQDGTVFNKPGYDPQTCLFYFKPADLSMPNIPENPSDYEVEGYLGYLLEAICDFPFVEDSDRANALGLIMTIPLRPAIPGNVPMAVITAPAPGTGKSLLQDTVAIIGTGKSAPMAGLPRDDDEMRKFITSRLLSGDPLISFDNLELPLWGPSLSRALTCTEWEDRILGGNTTARLPQRAVWIANGNNLKLRGDLPRRTFPIRLDAGLSRPWERQVFKHGNLIEWVSRYRGGFLAAIFTIARAWFVAGKPAPKKPVPVMGGFDAWAKTIGGILSFAGVDGFLENLMQFHHEADLEGQEWEGFLNAWVEVVGQVSKTCQEVAAILRDNSDFAATLPGNLRDVLKSTEKSFERTLGRVLAGKENRPYGENNLALRRVGTHNRAVLWKVAPLSEPVDL
jgi:hypothetical protein